MKQLERFYDDSSHLHVLPTNNVKEIKAFINEQRLDKSGNFDAAIEHVIKGLEQYTVHTSHPKYFGLFNPRPNFAGIVADLITAYYNPQLAAWSHSPFAAEVEAKLIKEFAKRFGYSADKNDGVFCSGGNEANQTAVLCALNHRYSKFSRYGLIGIKNRPIIFCSDEAHHSVHKAAKTAGLGYQSVKSIPVGDDLKLYTKELEEAIHASVENGDDPFMVIGTAGTTGTGTVDNLEQIHKITKIHNLWFHVDAAYGGAAALSQKLKNQLKGIEHSDSITFDAHKWMSVPMGTSIFITSNTEILGRTFSIETEYMPKDAEKLEIIDPFSHSIQWSRRFIGLKVYLSLLFYGWDGYEEIISHQAEMAEILRKKLTQNNWTIMNKTTLPVVCFTDGKHGKDVNFTKTILDKIYQSRKSWLSIYPINNINTFRVCITNYNTSEKELDELIHELNTQRKNYLK